MSKAGQFRDDSSLQAEGFWDAVRAAASTPDRETFQSTDPLKGGFLGLGRKVGAQILSIPSSIVDFTKAIPRLAPTVGAAMNPQGVMERMQLGGMGLDMLKNAVENPVSTAAGFASPGGAYAAAREGVYATLGQNAPHAMMWLRSMLPWYEGKPWTRVPGGVEDLVQRGLTEGSDVVHGGEDTNALNVANKLQPYLESRGESPLAIPPDALAAARAKWIQQEDRYWKAAATDPEYAEGTSKPPTKPSATRMPYFVPSGLEEVVGGAFVGATPGRTRILDDLRWYLDTGENTVLGSRGGTTDPYASSMNPVNSEQLRAMLGQWQKNPKEVLEIAKEMLGKGTMSGAPTKTGSYMEVPSKYYLADTNIGIVNRARMRDLLEVLAKRHGHAFPIDWSIDVPLQPEFAAARATEQAHANFSAAAADAHAYITKKYPMPTQRNPLTENWWDSEHAYAALARTRETIANARKVVEDAGSRLAKKPHQGLPPGVD